MILASLLELIDTTIVNVALPDIMGNLGATLEDAGWIITGYAVANVDVVVIAQKPKLAPHVDAIRGNLAGALGCDLSQVSVKGKTNEGVDSMGAGESIAVHAVALVNRI